MNKTTTRFRLLWRLWHAHVAWSLSLIALSSTVMKTTFSSDGDSSELPPDRQNVTCLKPLANFSITLTDDDDVKARNIDEFYGQCVGAHWRDRSGLHYATAIVGADLFRTAGECSDRAARRKAKREEKARKKRAEGGGDEGHGEEEADTDNDTDTDDDSDDDDDAKEKDDEKHMIGQNVGANKNQGSAKMSVRNLRIREDTAKYLLNLDVNSAFYDPKTRSMRNNPLAGTPARRVDPDPLTLDPDH